MRFLVAELSTSFLTSPSLASAKRFFVLFCFPLMTNCNFSLNVCSFLGFSSVEKNQRTDIKSDRGYLQINIVLFCITKSVLSDESPQKLISGL